MAQYSENKDGTITKYARYSVKGIPTSKTLFPDSQATSDLLILKNKQAFRSVYNRNSKWEVVRKIFYDFLIIVFKKLTKGGIFEFPGSTGANIALVPLKDESVRKSRKSGKFSEIDIVKTRFKIPAMVYDFGPNNPRRNRFIYLPKTIQEEIFKNAEQGKIKYSHKLKKINR